MDATTVEVFAAAIGGITIMMLIAMYGPPQPRGDRFFIWLLAMLAIGGAAGGMVYSLLRAWKPRR